MAGKVERLNVGHVNEAAHAQCVCVCVGGGGRGGQIVLHASKTWLIGTKAVLFSTFSGVFH